MALGRNFHTSCGKDGGKVGENPAALRAAVFSLASKKPEGGVQTPPPPSRARVKINNTKCMAKLHAGKHQDKKFAPFFSDLVLNAQFLEQINDSYSKY